MKPWTNGLQAKECKGLWSVKGFALYRNGYELVDACDFYNRGALQVVIKRAWAPQARWYGESLRFMLVSSAVSKARRPDPKQ